MNKQVSAAGGAKLLATGKRLPWGGSAKTLMTLIPEKYYHAKLDAIDAAMDHGTLEVDLPDGSFRVCGGRGAGPHAILRLHSWQALLRLALSGSAGWYQAWEAGEWSSDDPVPLFALFARNAVSLGGLARSAGPMHWVNRFAHELRRNNRRGARENIHAHYDIGNEFYAQWLDKDLNYSSGLYPEDQASLEEGQAHKIDAILGRLNLHRNARLLEIGCGWGALAKRAMDRFGLKYSGITLSDEQRDYAEKRLETHREADQAKFLLMDYRDMVGRFDAIASVEMVEAVGQSYWPDYLDAVARLLRPGGRAAIQFVAIDDALFPAYAADRDFIQAYIFPGGCLISESRFRALAEARGLAWLDQQSFGRDYAKTLREWRRRFDAAVLHGTLPPEMGPNFIRLWRYYLQYCEGGFEGGAITVSQVTLVKDPL